MLRPYFERGAVNLVDTWELFGKDARVIKIFTPIISSRDVPAIMPEGGPHFSIAEQVYGSLIQLGLESRDPVKIVLNSPGGNIMAGFTIIQAMEHLKAKGIEVWTVDLLEAASMAGILLMMGTRGRRFTLGDTLVHTHFGERMVGGKTHEDWQESVKHVERINERLYQLISDNSLIPEFFVEESDLPIVEPGRVKTDKELRVKLVQQFLNQNKLLSPEQAKKAGIIDGILLPGDPIIDQIYQAASKAPGADRA